VNPDKTHEREVGEAFNIPIGEQPYKDVDKLFDQKAKMEKNLKEAKKVKEQIQDQVRDNEQKIRIVNESLHSLKKFKEELDQKRSDADEKFDKSLLENKKEYVEIVKKVTSDYGELLKSSTEKFSKTFKESSSTLHNLIEEK